MAQQQTLPRRPRLIGPRKTFAIVASMYNEEYVQGLIDACKNEIIAIMPNSSIPLYRVPGAFEIPVCAEYVITHTGADVIIALGVVIKGETEHADIVGRTVARELAEMAVRHQVPVINEVLLLEDEAQARARCFGEDLNRGIESARAALSMAELFQKLQTAYPHLKSRSEKTKEPASS
ncbi:MAG: 6,7-dimethyl-8-ribityllumazine synthase [Verrucomicrobiales bacterium]